MAELMDAARTIVHRWAVQGEAGSISQVDGEMALETFRLSLAGLDLDLDELLDVANDVERITNQQFVFGVMVGVLFEKERREG